MCFFKRMYDYPEKGLHLPNPGRLFSRNSPRRELDSGENHQHY
ncbi:hypothetical protein DES53_11975 [Roseimicrobium gellanilyticum]|uniref:Uncharacterized protein n=1 Tax=Roseimicrobium gellanilyticum TaxID=748857 RepID=A0A366H2X2_9BACT|nr:hypothetical protein DES53_11975 [Roseimicrobium gellanilyticum]